MTEENIRKLLRKSMKNTSVDFTDNVMEKVEKKSEPLYSSIWTKGGFLIGIVMLVVIPVLFLNSFLENLFLWEEAHHFGYLPIKIGGLILVFSLINKALRIYEEWKALQSGKLEAK